MCGVEGKAEMKPKSDKVFPAMCGLNNINEVNQATHRRGSTEGEVPE
jgi:hypothetical protein